MSVIPRSDTVSSYILAESYQSLSMNRSVILDQKSNSNKDEIIDFDETVVFRITNGFSDIMANKAELDNYLEPINPILL